VRKPAARGAPLRARSLGTTRGLVVTPGVLRPLDSATARSHTARRTAPNGHSESSKLVVSDQSVQPRREMAQAWLQLPSPPPRVIRRSSSPLSA